MDTNSENNVLMQTDASDKSNIDYQLTVARQFPRISNEVLIIRSRLLR